MKKIIAGLLSAIAVFGSVPNESFIVPEKSSFTASAATKGTYGSMTYTMYDDYVEITGFDNSVSELEIPSEIEGVPVTIIADNAFKNATKLESVTIPYGVTEIGDYAFYQCTLLKYIDLPNSLINIGKSSFEQCISLIEIHIPNTVKTISSYAFKKCVSLQELDFPEGLTSFGEYVARECTGLLRVNIANGPSVIPRYSFANCSSLKEIYIPLSVSEIEFNEGMTFKDCPITDVYYAGSRTQWNTISEYGRNQLSTAQIHYGAKELPEPLTPDVNCDGAIDASDASLILAYYAYIQTGGTGTLEEYLNS